MSASLILFFKTDLSVSYVVFKTNQLVSSELTFAANLSYTVFLTISLFTRLLSLLKSTRTVFNLSIFISSASAFNLDKLDFNARVSTFTLMSPTRRSYGLEKY